jgi:hypothetical protein
MEGRGKGAVNNSEDDLVLPDNHPAVYKCTGLLPEAWVQPVFNELYGRYWKAARDMVFEIRKSSDWKSKTPFWQVESFGAWLEPLIIDAVKEFTGLITEIVYAHRGRITVKSEAKIVQEALSFARHLMSWNCAGSFFAWALGDGLPIPDRDRIEPEFRGYLEETFAYQGWVQLVTKNKMELERLRLVPTSKSVRQDRADGEYIKAMRTIAKDGRVGKYFWLAMEQKGFETPKTLQKQGYPKSISQALRSSECRKQLAKFKHEKTKRRSG